VATYSSWSSPIGLAAVVLVLVRGKTLFFDEHASLPPRRLDPLRRSSLTTRQADDTDTRKIPLSGQLRSRKYRIAPDVTEQLWALPTRPVCKWAWIPC